MLQEVQQPAPQDALQGALLDVSQDAPCESPCEAAQVVPSEAPQDAPQEDPYRLENPYSPAALQKRRRRKRITAGVVALVMIACVIGFAAYRIWDELRPVDFFSYADTPITIVGLTEEEFTITPQDLSEMDCIRMTASGTGSGRGVGGASKAGYVAAYGPLLEDFLNQYGYTQTDFRRIKVYCSDGYTVVLRGETLEYDIVMSIASGKDSLYDVQKPLRFVIPDEQSGKWAYGITKIEFKE